MCVVCVVCVVCGGGVCGVCGVCGRCGSVFGGVKGWLSKLNPGQCGQNPGYDFAQ